MVVWPWKKLDNSLLVAVNIIFWGRSGCLRESFSPFPLLKKSGHEFNNPISLSVILMNNRKIIHNIYKLIMVKHTDLHMWIELKLVKQTKNKNINACVIIIWRHCYFFFKKRSAVINLFLNWTFFVQNYSLNAFYITNLSKQPSS